MTNVIQNILYAADLSDDGEPVLAYAIDLANRLGAHLQVLTVISDQREKSLSLFLFPNRVLHQGDKDDFLQFYQIDKVLKSVF